MRKKARRVMLPGPLAVRFFDQHHRTPRRSLHLAEGKSFPILLTFFDMVRQRRSEHTVDDQWTEDGNAYLSERWTGSTRFQILRSRPPTGHTWIHGKPIKIQQTRRPEHYLARIKMLHFPRKRREVPEKFEMENEKIQPAREKRFIHEIDPHDSEYLKILPDAKDTHGSRSRTLSALRGRTHSRWQAETRRAFRKIECELQLKDTRAVQVKTKIRREKTRRPHCREKK